MEIIELALFSGIGGFSKGLEEGGITISQHYYSEVDKHAISVFRKQFNNSTYVGSVTNVRSIIRTIEGARKPGTRLILTFGSPCQDFSLAGKRGGLEGSKSSLIKYALFLIKRLRPDVYIWENVKGAYSTNDGADFWAIIQALANIDGYRREQQLLNTSWFLPQNRERIYLVGHLAGRSEPRVFPFTEKLIQNTTKFNQSCIVIDASHKNEGLRYYENIFPTLNARDYKEPRYVMQINPSKESGGKQPYQQNRIYDSNGISTTIDQAAGRWGISINSKIRRLTEIECERLQGFPDNWTEYGDYNGKIQKISKTQRYKMLGNAVSVPVVKAIAQKIKFI
jgi:DNA (cytosine-5)-methyltransferase 1